MDSTSIITQVSRGDDENLSTFPHVEKGKPKLFHKWRTGNEVVREGSSAAGKKPKNRGLLSSLFCCFGASQNSNNPTHYFTESYGEQLFARPSGNYLLSAVRHQDMHKKCVVIDLDETLVHSSFKPINNADFIVPVEIDGTVHQVYVLKRPYVDEFLQRMGEMFECVLFTASLAKYADPVADLLDKWGVFRSRLFRESCVFHKGNYVKDLGRLGRDLRKVIIIDNSPASYIFHPDNAVPVTSWFDDMNDRELHDLIPFFEGVNSMDNVYTVLRNANHPHHLLALPPLPQSSPQQQQQQQHQQHQQQQQQQPSHHLQVLAT